MSITKHERGYAAHFIGAGDCRFRRNTLVTDGERHIVVSTVGNYRPRHLETRDGRRPVETIGAFGRIYETMMFAGVQDGAYIEADVQRQVACNEPWSIGEPIREDSDAQADAMHEANVAWVVSHFEDAYAQVDPERRAAELAAVKAQGGAS